MRISLKIICISLCLCNCNQNNVENSSTHIVNKLPGKWIENNYVQSVNVIKKWSIGVAQGDETQEFYRPRDLDFDSEGNIYILDSGNFKIRVFDSLGKFKFQFGKKGAGPGEMSEKTHRLKFICKDTLIILDGNLQRFTLFDKNGKYLKSYSVETYIDDVVFLNNKFLYSNFILNKNHNPIHIYNKDKQKKIQSFGEVIEPSFNLFTLVEDTPSQFFFSYGGITNLAIDKYHNIYYKQEFPYLIKKYTIDGNKLFSFTRSTSFSTMSNYVFTKIGDEGVKWSTDGFATQSCGIQIVNDSLLVTSIFSGDKKENTVDFYDLFGQLLLCVSIPSQFDGSSTYMVSAKIDDDYNLYCLYNSSESFSKLDKYSININFNNQ